MAEAAVFSRGSSVLDYWLAHAEGMTVQPLDAVVEQVVAMPPAGRAERLIVRPRGSRRLREIPVGAIAAVEPASGRLLLEPRGPGRLGRTARATGSGTLAGVAWLAPRTGQAAVVAARDLAVGAAFVIRVVLLGTMFVGRRAYRAGIRGQAAVEARRRDRRSQTAQ